MSPGLGLAMGNSCFIQYSYTLETGFPSTCVLGRGPSFTVRTVKGVDWTPEGLPSYEGL